MADVVDLLDPISISIRVNASGWEKNAEWLDASVWVTVRVGMTVSI